MSDLLVDWLVRLSMRRARLKRLQELGAPPVVIDGERKLIKQALREIARVAQERS